MEKTQQIYLATKAFSKGWSYEELLRLYDVYDDEDAADEIWQYVVELKESGAVKFRQKYDGYNFYHLTL